MTENEKNLENIVADFKSICQTVQVVLNEWHWNERLQFPKLFGLMAEKLNWNESDVQRNDPLVRHFVRENPEYAVRIGLKGGIARTIDIEREKAEKEAKKAGKRGRKKKNVVAVNPSVMEEIRAEVESRVLKDGLTKLETRAILTDDDEEEFGS